MTALSPLGSIVAQLRGIAALPMSPFSHLLFALICLQFWMSDASAKGTNNCNNKGVAKIMSATGYQVVIIKIIQRCSPSLTIAVSFPNATNNNLPEEGVVSRSSATQTYFPLGTFQLPCWYWRLLHWHDCRMTSSAGQIWPLLPTHQYRLFDNVDVKINIIGTRENISH